LSSFDDTNLGETDGAEGGADIRKELGSEVVRGKREEGEKLLSDRNLGR